MINLYITEELARRDRQELLEESRRERLVLSLEARQVRRRTGPSAARRVWAVVLLMLLLTLAAITTARPAGAEQLDLMTRLYRAQGAYSSQLHAATC